MRADWMRGKAVSKEELTEEKEERGRKKKGHI